MNRQRAETVLAGLCGALTVITLVWPDWIEAIGFDPDGGDGGAEWYLVACLGLLTVSWVALAHREFTRQHVISRPQEVDTMTQNEKPAEPGPSATGGRCAADPLHAP